MAVKLMYRPSFNWVARTGSNIIHVASQNDEVTGCGKDVKEFRQLYNILLEYPKIEDAAFCKKCREAYHQRDEKQFPPVK